MRTYCPSNSIATADGLSVGLKVTSLKWTGPEPEDSEPIPPIPADIGYRDTVPRAEDIGFEDEESKLLFSQIEGMLTSASTYFVDKYRLIAFCEVGSSQEATQDVVERERLRMMMPVRETIGSNTFWLG